MPMTVTIPDMRFFDDDTQMFIDVKGETFKIEHSLVSVSKWESKWHKPFLSQEPKTTEELNDYVRCMTLTQNVREEIYTYIPERIMQSIMRYIDDPMTATTINSREKKKPTKKVITSEVIYGWMIGLNIPVEFQKWHLNRLMILIEIVNEQNSPAKKMGKNEIMSQNRALNAARRKALHTKG